jgi:hypothetical protein
LGHLLQGNAFDGNGEPPFRSEFAHALIRRWSFVPGSIKVAISEDRESFAADQESRQADLLLGWT